VDEDGGNLEGGKIGGIDGGEKERPSRILQGKRKQRAPQQRKWEGKGRKEGEG